METVAITAILFKAFVALVMAIGGVAAIVYGYRLFRDGIGLKKEGSKLEIDNSIVKIKYSAASVGGVLMLTSAVWGILANQTVPSMVSEADGAIKITSIPFDFKSTTLSAQKLPPDFATNVMSMAKQNPNYDVTLVGVSSPNEGTQSERERIESERAQTVKSALEAKGTVLPIAKTISATRNVSKWEALSQWLKNPSGDALGGGVAVVLTPKQFIHRPEG